MDKLDAQPDGLNNVTGDGTSSEMEARVAVLEQIAKDTKEILGEMKQDIRDIRQDQRTDFRLLFGALIAATLGLAGLMAHGFHWF